MFPSDFSLGDFLRINPQLNQSMIETIMLDLLKVG
jgi:hypothetical protein